jgi:beta-barrel assembly-enhancing protease
MMQRRSLLRASAWACGCASTGAFSSITNAQTSPSPQQNPLYQLPARIAPPELSSDEGGLWGLMAREEARLKRSHFLIRDEKLNEYLRSIVSKLSQHHNDDIRMYVVRNPWFNASMAPNGMLQIWTGLLLRTSNEAQLASILAHEVGHYVARHSVQSLRDTKHRAAFATFLGLFGVVGLIGNLALIAGMYAYSREHEKEADMIGIDLLAQAGYEPAEASKVWTNLLAEIRAENTANSQPERNSVMFATHPPSAEREKNLAERAVVINQDAVVRATGEQTYQRIVGPYRRQFAAEDIKRRRFAESEALYKRILNNAPDDWDAHFFLGEVYRTRSQEGDAQLALERYLLAEKNPAPPSELFRSMGLVHKELKKPKDASAYFQTYLEKTPQAEDAELIGQYIKEGI